MAEPESGKPDGIKPDVSKADEGDLARYAALLGQAEAVHGVSLSQDAWRRLRRNRPAMVSLAYLVVLAVVAVAAPGLPLQSPYRVNSHSSLAPPAAPAIVAAGINVLDTQGRLNEARLKAELEDLGWFGRGLFRLRLKAFGESTLSSVCGTDELGRDVLARLVWGARVSLMAGLVATLVSLVIGVSYGAIAGYAGGRIDNLMMRVVDILYSVPLIFIVIFLVTFLNEPAIKDRLEHFGVDRQTVFFLVVGAVYWLTMARVVRGQVVSLKHEPFIDAARSIGAGRGRIIFRHLVPNLMSVVIVYLTLTIPQVMLFEAFLSFLGLGVQAPHVSWGLLANQGFRVITPLRVYWWLILYPGMALGLTLFALNFLGDGLRDALDPRLRHR